MEFRDRSSFLKFLLYHFTPISYVTAIQYLIINRQSRPLQLLVTKCVQMKMSELIRYRVILVNRPECRMSKTSQRVKLSFFVHVKLRIKWESVEIWFSRWGIISTNNGCERQVLFKDTMCPHIGCSNTETRRVEFISGSFCY